MMDVRVFGDRVYSVANLTVFSIMFCIYGMLLVVTQYFQNVKDYSPVQAGLLLLAFTGPTIVLAPVAGRLAGRSGARRLVLVGMICLVLGMGWVAVGIGGPLVIIVVGLLLLGVASGFVVAPTTNLAMESIPPERAGMASGILSAQRALGSTAGFAVMGSILAGVVAATLPSGFAPYLAEPELSEAVDIVVEDANPRAVVSLIGPGKPLPDSIAETPELLAAADDSFVDGIRVALAVGGTLALVVLIIGFFVFPRGIKAQEAAAAETVRLGENPDP